MHLPCPSLDDLHAAAELPALPGEVEAHLSTCEACRGVLGSIREDNALAEELAGAAVPAQPGAPTELPAGTRVARYTVTGVLGVGGMGVVHRARQDSPAREVALKLIRAEHATPGLIRRFEHEAAALALLKHPGIAQVYEAGAASVEGRRRPFIAMELVEGERLDRFVRAHALPRNGVLRLVAAVCDAVEHAHLRGVIHRDLKPGNILVEAGAAPKILDFGVAKLTETAGGGARVEATQTGIGGFVGTLAYAAPEQVGGDPAAIDARADVFALGLILYELLVGQRAYTVDGPLHDVVKRVGEARVPPPGSRGVELGGELLTVLGTALALEPSRRYRSAAALADDLRRYLDKRPLRARPESALYTLRKAVARRPYRAAAAAAFLALAVGAGAVAVTLQLRASRAESAKGRVLDAVLSALERTDQDELGTPKLVKIEDFLADAGPVVEEQLAGFPEERALVLRRLGRASLSHNRLEQAAEMLLRVADHRAARSRAEPLAYAEALIDLGRAKYRLSEFEAARDLFITAHDLRVKELGEVHPETIAARYRIGTALHGWKKYDLAEGHLRAAAGAQLAALPDSPEAAEYLNGVAACVRARGDFAAALALARQALALTERNAGPEAKHIAVPLGNIAANLISLGRLDEADPVIARALALRQSWYGPDDPRLADTLVQLTGLKMRRGGFGETPGRLAVLDEAAELARRSLALRQKVYAGDHESVAEALSLLGQVRMRQARYDQARPALTAAMEMRGRLPRRHEGDLGKSESLLGECLRRAGEPEEAGPLLRSGLEKIQAAYGPDHRQTLEARERLDGLR